MVCTGVFNFIARLGFCDSKEGINGCLTNCSSNNFECYSTCYRTNGWLPPLSTAEKIVYPTTAAILLLLSLVVACMMSTTLGIDMSSLQAAIDGIDSVIRKQASKVVGLRKKGSLLLTSLLIASTGLNVAFTVFIADILGLLLGFIACTFLILVFVEILPPAICAYDALWIAASTAWFGKILIVILFPISYPLSLILDSYLLRRQDDDDDDGDGDSSSRGGCISMAWRPLCCSHNSPEPLSPRVFVVNPLANKSMATTSNSTLSPSLSVASGDASNSMGFSDDMDSAQRMDMAGFGLNLPKSSSYSKGYPAESSRAREGMREGGRGGYREGESSSRANSRGQLGPSPLSGKATAPSSEIEEWGSNGDSKGGFKQGQHQGQGQGQSQSQNQDQESQRLARSGLSLDSKFSSMFRQQHFFVNHPNRWSNPQGFRTIPGIRPPAQFSAPELFGKPPRHPVTGQLSAIGQNTPRSSMPPPFPSHPFDSFTPSPSFPPATLTARKGMPVELISTSSDSVKESQTEVKNELAKNARRQESEMRGKERKEEGEREGGREKAKNDLNLHLSPSEKPNKGLSVISSTAASLSAFVRSSLSSKPSPDSIKETKEERKVELSNIEDGSSWEEGGRERGKEEKESERGKEVMASSPFLTLEEERREGLLSLTHSSNTDSDRSSPEEGKKKKKEKEKKKNHNLEKKKTDMVQTNESSPSSQTYSTGLASPPSTILTPPFPSLPTARDRTWILEKLQSAKAYATGSSITEPSSSLPVTNLSSNERVSETSPQKRLRFENAEFSPKKSKQKASISSPEPTQQVSSKSKESVPLNFVPRLQHNPSLESNFSEPPIALPVNLPKQENESRNPPEQSWPRFGPDLNVQQMKTSLRNKQGSRSGNLSPVGSDMSFMSSPNSAQDWNDS